MHIHYHGPCTTSATKSNSETVAVDDYRSFLLNNEERPAEKAHSVESALISHDYDELYLEPASEEEELLQQLKQLPIPIIPEENIKYICLLIIFVVVVIVVSLCFWFLYLLIIL